MRQPETTVRIEADTRGFDAAIKAASESTRDFGRIFTSTIKTAITSGKGFEDTLRSMAMRISNMALNKAFAPVENSISTFMSALLAGAAGGGPVPNARGGAYGPGGPVPFAKGGVVSAPTLFSFKGGAGGNIGLMGEAGAEAIMPLARGPDGRLGVATGQAAAPVNVVFNVSAQDAASFRRSEGQITALLARTVQRGQRKL